MAATRVSGIPARWASSLVAAFALVSATVGVVDVIEVELLGAAGCESGCATPMVPPPAEGGPDVLLSRPEPTESTVPVVPERAAAPTLITIAALGVSAPVDAVGLLDSGGLAVPDDAARVGWFAPEGFELAPGDQGTAVLAGHRDSRRTGPGALHALPELTPGMRIVVAHADDRVSHWQVERSVLTPRDALPVDELFTRSGPSRLALVTCGGTFDAASRRYSHNIIVYFSPVEPAEVVAPR